MMTVDAFLDSLGLSGPPLGMPPLLQALWWDGNGDWARGHAIAQDETGPCAAWVHAYLHRKEGDDWNARYWYRQAGRRPFAGSFAEEWRAMVTELLG